MAIPADPSPSPPFQEDFEDFFENSLSGFLITNAKGEIPRGARARNGELTVVSTEEVTRFTFRMPM